MRATTFLLPLASAQTMYLTSLLASDPTLSTLLSTLSIAPSGWSGSLGSTPITILAPTNNAFRELSDARNQSIADRDRDAVQQLLAYHIIQGTYTSANLTQDPVQVRTLSGQTYGIALVRSDGNAGRQNTLRVDPGEAARRQSVEVAQLDIQTIPNVTVHKIDRMLGPNSASSSSPSGTPSGTASVNPSGTASEPAQGTGGAGSIGGGLGAVVGFGVALIL